MKTGIHPEVNQVNARCACGQTFSTISTSTELSVDICSACHPFYTGQKRFVDTAGRIEKFQQRYQASRDRAVKSKK